jgi:lipopolysaccharide export LptBFGC system permease protein LptF
VTFGILFRYVTGRFLLALTLFTAGMIAFAILVHFLIRIEKIIDVSEGSFFGFVLQYYSYQLPYFIVLVLPISVLFAAVFTLSRLSKANELVPMMVGGLSLRRVSLPFIAAAVLAVPILAWIHLAILPASWKQLAVMEDLVRGAKKVISVVPPPDKEGNRLNAARYHRDRKVLELVKLRLKNGGDREIECKVATCEAWDENAGTARWRLTQGTIYPLKDGRRMIEPNPDGGERLVSEEIPEEGLVVTLGITPLDLIRRGGYGEYLTLGEAIRLSRRHPERPLYRMQLYEKFTEPLAPLLLLLLGLPLAMGSTDSRSVFVGMGLSILVVVAFFGIKLILQQLGNEGSVPAALATIAPALAFAAAGTYLFARIRT